MTIEETTYKICDEFDKWFASIVIENDVDPRVVAALVIARILRIGEELGAEDDFARVLAYAVNRHNLVKQNNTGVVH